MVLLLTGVRSEATDTTYMQMSTSLGNINLLMKTDEAPMNVNNFMSYVNSGAYNNSIIHRSVPGFVIQGGGYTVASTGKLTTIPTGNAVTGEASPTNLNLRGTLALALSNGPNSGTDEWFFNLVDNPELDDTSDGGPFTVFASVADPGSIAVMDAIASVPTYTAVDYFTDYYASDYAPWDSAADFAAAFGDLPLLESSTPLTASSFVVIYSITPLTNVATYSSWQTTNFTGALAGQGAATATPFNDGVSNLLKYLCDVDPTKPITTAERANLPTVGSTTISGTSYMTLTYHAKPAAVGVAVSVETCTDMATWAEPTNATANVSAATDGSGDTVVQYLVPAPTSGCEFIRLSLTATGN